MKESLKIKTLAEVIQRDISPKFKEVTFDFTPSETSTQDAIQSFLQAQESYDKISHLRNFQAVIEVLRGNQLEHKDRKIYKDLSVLDLT